MRIITIAAIILAGFLPFINQTVRAQADELPDPAAEYAKIGQTPPRLSLIEGAVSFWRPGAEDWTQAQVNTPIAPGDQLYTSAPGKLELQVGARAFVRASQNTYLGLENQEPDFLQFTVTSGVAAFDLRTIEPGRSVQVDTPQATFVIENEGYYRVEVNGESTSFITRRSGEATARLADGDAVRIEPGEKVVVEGAENPRVTAFASPELDKWDKWNYARTDRVLEAVSSRYVSQDIYGVADLDKAGRWRVVPTYGAVWVPYGVPAGWAPYSTGAWVRDPFYGWTWVDAAPWGWAPYHYGRWVYVSGHWAWAPGPMMARPHYAPALVAFLGVHGGSVGIRVATGPLMAWVALGWGEPVVPWWGPPHFRLRPYWSGWHGPRIVNQVVVHRTTVVHVHDIHVYRNTSVRHAVVAVHGKHFGHGRITREQLAHVNARNLRPAHNLPRIDARPENYAPQIRRGSRPSDKIRQRSVVSMRPSPAARESAIRTERPVRPTGRSAPEPDRVSRNRNQIPVREHRQDVQGRKLEGSLSDRPRPPVRPQEGAIGNLPSRNTTDDIRRIRPDHASRLNRPGHPETRQPRQVPPSPDASGALRRQAPSIMRQRESEAAHRADRPAPRKPHSANHSSRTMDQLPGVSANRSRTDRSVGSSFHPGKREAPGPSPEREAAVQRQVRSSPRQAGTISVDSGQRMGGFQRRGR